MARAPETGFYFEPMTERLALVVEGAPFPSDDQWAYVGDPVEMSTEAARLEVATRWPGVDPETLDLEFETNFERATAEIDRLQREEREAGPDGGEIDFDVSLFLQQAEELKEMAANLAPPGAADLERELERSKAATVGGSIARAHERSATSRPPPEKT